MCGERCTVCVWREMYSVCVERDVQCGGERFTVCGERCTVCVERDVQCVCRETYSVCGERRTVCVERDVQCVHVERGVEDIHYVRVNIGTTCCFLSYNSSYLIKVCSTIFGWDKELYMYMYMYMFYYHYFFQKMTRIHDG